MSWKGVMGKKGQVYIFTSIVLVLLLIGIIPRAAQTYDDENVFGDLVEDYTDELPNVLNNALYNDLPINGSVYEFSEYFIDYSRQRDSAFGFFAVVRDGDDMYMINMLNENARVSLDTGDVHLAMGESYETDDDDQFIVEISDGEYEMGFDVLPDLQMRVLFKSERNRNIYIRQI